MSIIICDQMLHTMNQVFKNLKVNEKRIQDNLYITKGQIFAEFVLEALIKKGMPRMTCRGLPLRQQNRMHYGQEESSKLTHKELDSVIENGDQ